jgi:hypothetical protein
MDAIRVLLAAVVCLGLAAGPPALAQQDPPKPWKQVRGFGRVLNLTTLPVVIDEPGVYAIDRDWHLDRAAAPNGGELIRITADDVTLDLHGFEITWDVFAPPSATLLVVNGRGVEVRNGGLGACCDGAVAIQATVGPTLHHLALFSGETMTFETGASIRDSEITARVEMRFGARSSLERNTISCVRGSRCIRLLGDANVFTHNELSITQGGGIEVVGNGSVVANNVVDKTDDADGLTVFDVKGNHNVVRDNTVLNGNLPGQPLWAISGTANTLEGNIAVAPAPGQRALTGMQFTADGNFYGNNRMAADVPFSLGGTVQTDWGGNVGY